jgi:hypothetical protein
MIKRFYLHDLDDMASMYPYGGTPAENISLPMPLAPGCEHPPVCTVVMDEDAGVLRLMCTGCEAQIAVAVGTHWCVPVPCAHGNTRCVRYCGGLLLVSCADCAAPLWAWFVAPLVPERESNTPSIK